VLVIYDNSADNQYSLILVLFYIPYGTLNIPATVLAKRFSPAIVIPTLMFGWGTIALATAAVHNFGGILAARICLGVVEAGFVRLRSLSLAVWLISV
jgi:MFS family permease